MTGEKEKKRVLVVDDQPKVLKFIEIDLKLRGFEVISATSGNQALELTKMMKPDIILLDMIMPGLNGFEILKELRVFTNLPVIAFSASLENQDESLRCGANDFVHKPFNPDDMVRRIRALLK
jgi:two-component system KDP operon response regulator KdpE